MTWIILVVVLHIIDVACVSNAPTRDLREIERHGATAFRPANAPVNLSVSVSVLNITSKQLGFNISWNADKDLTKSYNIHIWPMNESDSYCSSEPYYGFINCKDCDNWQIPSPDSNLGLLDSLRIIAGCSYSIRLEANPHDGKTFAQTNFTVPECVDTVCSCRHATSLPRPQLKVEPMSPKQPYAVNISWALNSTDQIENITSFIVRAGPHLHGTMYNLSWYKQVKYAATLHSQNLHNSSFWLQYTATKVGSNIATVRAVDFSQCWGPESQITFFVNEDDFPNLNAVSSKESESWINPLTIGCSIAVILLSILIVWKKCFRFIHRERNARFDKRCFFYKPVGCQRVRVFRKHNSLQERNVLYVEKEIEEAQSRGEVDQYEISAGRLEFKRWIGHGAFGRVFLASADTICGVPGTQLVAVKTLKAGAETDQRKEFLEEISMLKRVGRHANVVSLLACVTMAADLCMVMEYVPCGDLLNYLRTLRQKLDNRKPSVASMSDMGYPSSSTMETSLCTQHSIKTSLPTEELQLEQVLDHKELHNFALQISRGMAHLEAKNITHRDLAARNILIDEKKTLKISDFGLSRRGVYVNTRKQKVPLRWLSLEAMRDSLYSTKSDVWAFAIVMWEIGTLGGFPYPTVLDYDLLQFLNQGHRLEKPEIVSNELYRVMRICWSEKPNDRPTFAELVTFLETKSGDHVYVEIIPNPQLPPTVQYTNIDHAVDKTS